MAAAQGFAHQPALNALRQRTHDAFVDIAAADIHQAAVTHTRWASGFAVPTGEAAIQMTLGLGGYRCAFHHFFHQVNTTTRAIELVTQNLIGWARGGTEATVHTFVNNGLECTDVGIILEFGNNLDLHDDLRDPDTNGRD